MDFESDPFLPESHHGVNEKDWHCECCKRKHNHIKFYIAAIALQLLAILTLAWTLAKTTSTAPEEVRSVQSVASFGRQSLLACSTHLLTQIAPTHDAVEYRIDTPPPNFWENELYVQPSYESDYAWNDLMDSESMILFRKLGLTFRLQTKRRDCQAKKPHNSSSQQPLFRVRGTPPCLGSITICIA